MSRAQLTSTVEQNTGGAVAPLVAGKNLVINGGFDIWQRGTSITSADVYTADRWYTQFVGGATTSQQTTGTPNGSRYCLRSASTASAGGANYYHFIETNNVAQMWGKTVTFTILLRRNSTMSSSLNVAIYKSATVDAGIAQHPATALASVTIANASLPTGTGSSNWYPVTITASIPNDGTANSVYITVTLSANIPTSAYWEMAQAQLEVGSVATPFSRAGGTLSGELAACQRYYWRNSTATTYGTYALCYALSTTNAYAVIPFPVPMRTIPTSIDYSSLAVDFSGISASSVSSATGNQATNLSAGLNVTTTGLTQYRVYDLCNNNSTSGYIGYSAEL